MHALERLAQKAEDLQLKIKKAHSDNKSLGLQVIAGARENADYSTPEERWSMEWYVNYIKELESRAK